MPPELVGRAWPFRRWALRWTTGLGLAVAAVLVVSLLLLAWPDTAEAKTSGAPGPAVAGLDGGRGSGQAVPDCMKCHSQPDLAITFASGEKLPLFVDIEAFRRSVHGDRVSCDACHPAHTRYPHPPLAVTNHRDYILGYYQVCGRCHFENYTKTVDSVHYDVLAEGRKEAPTCADCHGSHDVTPPNQPRRRIPENCATCHQAIYDEYAKSVHGGALLGEDNPDVPVCTDCHGVHEIKNPEVPAFRLASVDICAQCHSDKKRMEKYGISTNVLKSYLDDFHGKTFAFYKRESSRVWLETPVCTDCHGVHDIIQVDSPDSPVLKANLLSTCRRCHPDAGPNFPSAWLSHYEPTLSRAPLVFAVRWFYRLLIPLIVGGLMLHIMLDVWRLARNR